MLIKIFDFIKKILFGYYPSKCVGVVTTTTEIFLVELDLNSLCVVNYHIKKINFGTSFNLMKKIEMISHEIIKHKNEFNYNSIAINIEPIDIVTRELIIPNLMSNVEIRNCIQNILIDEFIEYKIGFDYNVLETFDNKIKLQVKIAKIDKYHECCAIADMSGMQLVAIEESQSALEYLFHILMKQNNIFADIWAVDIGNDLVTIYLFKENQIVHSSSLQIESLWQYETLNNTQYKEQAVKLVLIISKLITIIKNKLTSDNDFCVLPSKMYLMGASSLYFRLDELIIKDGIISECKYVDELFPPQKLNISRYELLSMVTAIALATWGHRIETN